MDKEKWSRMPEEETIKDTIKAIKSRGVNVILVENREAALNKLKDIFAKFAWALGFPWINEGKIEELFEKGW